jgi:TPR repeat protein
MYTRGLGVTRDDAEAVNWYRKAAEQGYAPAKSILYGLGISGRLGAH